MEFKKIIKGKALYAEKDRLWIAQGMTFFAINYAGKRVTRKFRVGSYLQTILSLHRITRQTLREGLHHLIPLSNGDIFVTAKRKSFTVDGKSGRIKNIFKGYLGNKPGHQGVLLAPNGSIFFAEYTINLDHKNDTHLYRSDDNGMTFKVIKTFPKNVRHIHFIKYDPYENCLWLGTGDADHECFLMRSDDNGDSWQMIGEGSQDWRAIGICFHKDYLIWGTDAGSVPDQNHLVRMRRDTHELEIIENLEGPCHGCGSFSDGRVFISTGVEGGENEKDRFARLKQVEGNSCKDVLHLKKDFLPLICQYGVMRFPLGTDNTNNVIFTSMALSGAGEFVLMEKN